MNNLSSRLNHQAKFFSEKYFFDSDSCRTGYCSQQLAVVKFLFLKTTSTNVRRKIMKSYRSHHVRCSDRSLIKPLLALSILLSVFAGCGGGGGGGTAPPAASSSGASAAAPSGSLPVAATAPP